MTYFLEGGLSLRLAILSILNGGVCRAPGQRATEHVCRLFAVAAGLCPFGGCRLIPATQATICLRISANRAVLPSFQSYCSRFAEYFHA